MCPNCGLLTHPEYLTYVIKTGEVVGCSDCIQHRNHDPAP